MFVKRRKEEGMGIRFLLNLFRAVATPSLGHGRILALNGWLNGLSRKQSMMTIMMRS